MDYIFRWLQLRFLTGQQQMLFENLRIRSAPPAQSGGAELEQPVRDLRGQKLDAAPSAHHAADALSSLVDLGDAPTCSFCGSIMTRNGSCYRCMSCGSTSGCS
jgi:ribonucleoside-diphosphate reductase alpha chain